MSVPKSIQTKKNKYFFIEKKLILSNKQKSWAIFFLQEEETKSIYLYINISLLIKNLKQKADEITYFVKEVGKCSTLNFFIWGSLSLIITKKKSEYPFHSLQSRKDTNKKEKNIYLQVENNPIQKNKPIFCAYYIYINTLFVELVSYSKRKSTINKLVTLVGRFSAMMITLQKSILLL